MQFFLKVSFSMFASLFFLHLPFASSIPGGNHTNNKENIQEMSPKLVYEIAVHGFLLWASMGFLMPIGILTIRMSNRQECGTRLKLLAHVHTISQILSAILATAGAVMSIKNFNNTFNNNHQRLGLVLYGVIWLQALLGFIRPNRGSRGRRVWFFTHWLLGTSVAILGIINVYTGLIAYHEKTSRTIKFWTIIFTAEISFFVFFYLLQDKWVYVEKHGVIFVTESEKLKELDSSGDKQENC